MRLYLGLQAGPWTFVYDGLDVSDMVARLNFLIQLDLDNYCPTKTVRTSNLDGKVALYPARWHL